MIKVLSMDVPACDIGTHNLVINVTKEGNNDVKHYNVLKDHVDEPNWINQEDLNMIFLELESWSVEISNTITQTNVK